MITEGDRTSPPFTSLSLDRGWYISWDSDDSDHENDNLQSVVKWVPLLQPRYKLASFAKVSAIQKWTYTLLFSQQSMMKLPPTRSWELKEGMYTIIASLIIGENGSCNQTPRESELYMVHGNNLGVSISAEQQEFNTQNRKQNCPFLESPFT